MAKPIILTPCPYDPIRPPAVTKPAPVDDWEEEEMLTSVDSPEAAASDPHLDLIRAPYLLYGVKYIDLVSLWRHGAERDMDNGSQFDLIRAPYCYGLYGVKCIDAVWLDHAGQWLIP